MKFVAQCLFHITALSISYHRFSLITGFALQSRFISVVAWPRQAPLKTNQRLNHTRSE